MSPTKPPTQPPTSQAWGPWQHPIPPMQPQTYQSQAVHETQPHSDRCPLASTPVQPPHCPVPTGISPSQSPVVVPACSKTPHRQRPAPQGGYSPRLPTSTPSPGTGLHGALTHPGTRVCPSRCAVRTGGNGGDPVVRRCPCQVGVFCARRGIYPRGWLMGWAW